MNKAVAFADNEVAFLAWTYDKKIPNCLGFSIHRKDVNANAETTLPAWVGFEGGNNRNWTAKTTDEWPVQKFNWRDLTAKTGGSYQYRIVPRIGAPGRLEDAAKGLELTTNRVDITPARGAISAYFNNGILSTQSIAHLLPHDPSGAPSSAELMRRITTPGNDLRNRLAGQQIEALLTLLTRAEARGECYGALYELSDPELLAGLKRLGHKLHLILSNTGADDTENAPHRPELRHAGVELIDRMMPSGHIGHNKFMVYVDAAGTPQTVLTGSTNWTATGLCAQSNNAVIVEDRALAAAYMAYWHRLQSDTKGVHAEQTAAFRQLNNRAVPIASLSTDLWFSPNTQQRSKPAGNAPRPGDLTEVFGAIGRAKSAILFLLFQPGSPSILDAVAEAQRTNPALIVRGAATDPKAAEEYQTLLFHRTPGQPDVVEDTAKDTPVVRAAEIKDEFAYWHKELLKSSPGAHAIIHDKVVVIDPLSPECVVITGSHNLGYRASYNNDENLLVIRGNRPIAAAFTTHVMDVYDHYRWRFWLQSKKDRAWTGLKKTDAWQKPYFDARGFVGNEVRYWTGQAATPPASKTTPARRTGARRARGRTRSPRR